MELVVFVCVLGFVQWDIGRLLCVWLFSVVLSFLGEGILSYHRV
jgi:hypothetical protein